MLLTRLSQLVHRFSPTLAYTHSAFSRHPRTLRTLYLTRQSATTSATTNAARPIANSTYTAPRLATIQVTNLRLRTFVGFNDEEREKRQDVVVNLSISHELAAGVFSDSVDDALNYKTITKAIIQHVEDNRFLLLEKLASDLLDICTRSSRVQKAAVTVDKPHALRFADSVSITVAFDAADLNVAPHSIRSLETEQ